MHTIISGQPTKTEKLEGSGNLGTRNNERVSWQTSGPRTKQSIRSNRSRLEKDVQENVDFAKAFKFYDEKPLSTTGVGHALQADGYLDEDYISLIRKPGSAGDFNKSTGNATFKLFKFHDKPQSLVAIVNSEKLSVLLKHCLDQHPKIRRRAQECTANALHGFQNSAPLTMASEAIALFERSFLAVSVSKEKTSGKKTTGEIGNLEALQILSLLNALKLILPLLSGKASGRLKTCKCMGALSKSPKLHGKIARLGMLEGDLVVDNEQRERQDREPSDTKEEEGGTFGSRGNSQSDHKQQLKEKWYAKRDWLVGLSQKLQREHHELKMLKVQARPTTRKSIGKKAEPQHKLAAQREHRELKLLKGQGGAHRTRPEPKGPEPKRTTFSLQSLALHTDILLEGEQEFLRTYIQLSASQPEEIAEVFHKLTYELAWKEEELGSLKQAVEELENDYATLMPICLTLIRDQTDNDGRGESTVSSAHELGRRKLMELSKFLSSRDAFGGQEEKSPIDTDFEAELVTHQLQQDLKLEIVSEAHKQEKALEGFNSREVSTEFERFFFTAEPC
ncbi:hypothetical protein L7F22_058451 [Adiantum nelumboides]|nr:hypothetical protein [Adiantum nelumboides]